MRPAAGSFLVLAVTLVLAACAGPSPRPPSGPAGEPVDGPPDGPVDVSNIPEPVPRDEPLSRYGNPASYVVYGRTYHVQRKRTAYEAEGVASWYGSKFHGRRTSSGEPYDMYRYTAAHRTLPLPSFLKVTNLDNGRSVIVRVNDRGPFKDDRLIDLSYAAAVRLGFADRGTARVKVRAVGPGIPQPARANTESSSDPNGLWLQAGAFRDEANARRLRRRLADAGLAPVEIRKAEVGDDSIYRVRIGPIESERHADDMARRLESLGYDRPRRVRE